jgi:uncharacterized coiled-coil protein SlyX
MIFDTKDEKINKMEKRINEMERKMKDNFEQINETISTLNEIIVHLQTENTKLKNEKDFLVERHKKMLRRVPVPDLSREVNSRLVKPVAKEIRESANLLSNVVTEGFVELTDPDTIVRKKRDPAKELKEHVVKGEQVSSGKTIDRLFEIISETGKIRADEAARRLNVHEIQVEEWAKILEEHELITMKKQFGKVELSKA